MEVITVFFVICWCAIKTDAQFFGRERTPSYCYNPNQRVGTCVAIYDCQTIMSVLKRSPLQQYDAEFVKASKCKGGYGDTPYVCCTRDTGFTRFQFDDYEPQPNYWDSPRRVAFPTHNNDFVFYDDNRGREQRWPSGPQGQGGQRWPGGQRGQQGRRGERSEPVGSPSFSNAGGNSLLPQPPRCGGVTIANKIYGGFDADVFEFPWMVMLEYKRRAGGISSNCAGSLINERYVLTAAHCVTGLIESRIGQLISVRLGEHDQTTQIDCNQNSCAPEALRVGIESVTAHELYRDDALNKENDIALIRLDRKIGFTESVRPICLPSAWQQERQHQYTAGTRYTVAGWGRTLKAPRSAVKQKLIVTSVDQQECQRKFRQRKVEIVDSQLCAGGEYAKDSCEGDSGGPLMRFNGKAWVLEGIVSFGIKCGLKDVPAIHTRVASYEDWIRSTIRA